MNPLLHLIVRPGPQVPRGTLLAAPSLPTATPAPSVPPTSAARAAPTTPAAAATPDDMLPRCGWFDSSLDLRAGLLVEEHASADAVAGDLPLAAWLALHLAGGPARPGAASSGA